MTNQSTAVILVLLTLLFSIAKPSSGAESSVLSMETAIQSLGKQISASMLQINKTKIAVSQFFDSSAHTTAFGDYIAESLTTELFQASKFDVYERALLSQVLSEHKLAISGVIDKETAKQIGKLTGVDAIVTGTASEMYDCVGVNVRVISTETGQVFSAARVRIEKDSNVDSILNKNNSSEETNKETKAHISDSGQGRSLELLQPGTYSIVLGSKSEQNANGDLVYQITSVDLQKNQMSLNLKLTCSRGGWGEKCLRYISPKEIYIADTYGSRVELTNTSGLGNDGFETYTGTILAHNYKIFVGTGENSFVQLSFDRPKNWNTQGLTLQFKTTIAFGVGSLVR